MSALSSEAEGSIGSVAKRSLDGRALVFGEVLFDHFEDGARVLGGAPFNVAWHLCGFGADPFLISAVGADEEGQEILDRIQGWGLSGVGVARDSERPTGRVDVKLSDGHPSFTIPPDQAWDRIPEPPSKPGQPAVFYHGSLALRSADSRTRCLALRERMDAPVFVDLNLRAPWWTPEIVDACLRGIAWLKVSEEELATLTGMDAETEAQCENAARALADRHGLPNIVITRAERGSMLVRPGRPVLAEAAHPDTTVVDTVGAGDAFSAVACLGIVQGWEPREILRRANAFAADVCGFRGATTGDLSLYERHLRGWSEFSAREPREPGLHVLSLSVHGLVRGEDIELGRDADTGGQVSYVVDQARALGRHPEVEQVTVLTRLIEDRRIDDAYAVPEEDLGDGARIVRLPFGPRRYLRKESLWPHLDALLDQVARWIRSEGETPDVIQGHYADAGYVGAQMSKLLGVPFVFTGHSLGRVKRARLLADGQTPEVLEERYRISRRIEAEEHALEAADLVIASTSQEVDEQLARYDHYAPERMQVIPPGVDLGRFSPPPVGWDPAPVAGELRRFLTDPEKPLILAVARADERKNLAGLLRAFGEHSHLRERANLAIIAGNRDDIRTMDAGPRRVLNELVLLVDALDLYGKVAYPKHHTAEDVPELYRLAALRKGIFVNPALTEPFGLTLLEAAATGLPVVATDDGGPRDILATCSHGLLADPLDIDALGTAIDEALRSEERWGRWSKNAVARVHEHFSWASHASTYVEEAKRVLSGRHPGVSVQRSRLTTVDRLVVTDVDGTLTGDDEGVAALRSELREGGPRVGFGIATGRTLDSALKALDELDLDVPDVLFTSSGTEIRYGRRLVLDRSWERQIRHRWEPERIRALVDTLDGCSFDPSRSTTYRLRYRLAKSGAPSLKEIRGALRRKGVRATVLLDRGTNLDVLPIRASPGLALRFFGFKWDLPPERILVAGDSGNDRPMLEGEMLGVVVGNHTPALESLREHPRVFFAEAPHARGVCEGIRHYDFLGTIRTEDLELDDR